MSKKSELHKFYIEEKFSFVLIKIFYEAKYWNVGAGEHFECKEQR